MVLKSKTLKYTKKLDKLLDKIFITVDNIRKRLDKSKDMEVTEIEIKVAQISKEIIKFEKLLEENEIV